MVDELELRRTVDELGLDSGRLQLSRPETLSEQLASGDEQGGFAWNRENWKSWLSFVSGIDAFLSSLPAKVSRASVMSGMRSTDDPVLQFVAVMIWGYGSAGYGPYRTARVLTEETSRIDHERVSPAVQERLALSQQVVGHDPLSAFYYLNNKPGRIYGLGSAFFTKWLYFSSAQEGPDKSEAPIFDERVRVWLRDQPGVGELKLRHNRTRSYHDYLRVLDAYGAPEGYTRARVERAIFALTELPVGAA